MGTWDIGPFDNDTAADWCATLDEAAPHRRATLIRDALTTVAEHGAEYLDSDEAVKAIAAAAIIASHLPGGSPITTPYAPDFLLHGGTIDVPDDLPAIAVQALARILGEDSEWRDLWAEAEESYPQALATLQTIREPLERAIPR